jgi:hypothetical protein
MINTCSMMGDFTLIFLQNFVFFFLLQKWGDIMFHHRIKNKHNVVNYWVYFIHNGGLALKHELPRFPIIFVFFSLCNFLKF